MFRHVGTKSGTSRRIIGNEQVSLLRGVWLEMK